MEILQQHASYTGQLNLKLTLKKKICQQLKAETALQCKTEPETLHLNIYDKLRKLFYLRHMFLRLFFPFYYKRKRALATHLPPKTHSCEIKRQTCEMNSHVGEHKP